jgi:hypothetical protein
VSPSPDNLVAKHELMVGPDAGKKLPSEIFYVPISSMFLRYSKGLVIAEFAFGEGAWPYDTGHKPRNQWLSVFELRLMKQVENTTNQNNTTNSNVAIEQGTCPQLYSVSLTKREGHKV